MTKTIGAQLITLPEIFDGHLLTIPNYQRGYAWEDKQVEELLLDLDHLLADQAAHRHYTGTVVLSRPAELPAGEFHVVDGQQRLTTLTIFMRLLSEYLPEDAKDAFQERYLRRGSVGNQRTVLVLNEDTQRFYERVVMGDGNVLNEPTSLEAHERLLSAREKIRDWLAARIEAGITVQTLRNTVESKLGFLVYAPKEDAETGIMFEVINNRGKLLSDLEKVKNYLIYCSVKLGAEKLRKAIDQDWSSILRYLNIAKKTTSQEEGAFLRYCVAVYFKLNKTDSQYAYDQLKKILALNESLKSPAKSEAVIRLIEGFVQFLLQASLWYARLYGRLHDGLNKDLIVVLDQLRAQARHASIMPLFFAAVIKLQGQGDRLQKLLSLLECLNFRVYMARNMTARNDTGQGDLYYFASRYYHDALLADFSPEQRKLTAKRSLETEEDALEFCLVRFTLWMANDERFKQSFVLDSSVPNDYYHFDFYRWDGIRYFLMSYEAKLQPNRTISIDKILLSRLNSKSGDYLSVEHIWATANRNAEDENNRTKDTFQRRRLGNFVLLDLRSNIKGSNEDLEVKVDQYNQGDEPSDLTQVRSMVKDASAALKALEGKNRNKSYYLELHRTLNDRQEARFVEFAEKRWALKGFLGYNQLLKQAELSSVSNDED